MMQTDVILVDREDQELGRMEKMEAHHQGVLHRAFSIFLFNQQGEMLLQQRSLEKYHSGGLWTNACCSHPLPGESTSQAAERRLQEELGITGVPLEKIFDFVYRANMGNGLTEHEFDHVFMGEYEGPLHPDPSEVAGTAYRSMPWIRLELGRNPEQFTAWFRLAFAKIAKWWDSRYGIKN